MKRAFLRIFCLRIFLVSVLLGSVLLVFASCSSTNAQATLHFLSPSGEKSPTIAVELAKTKGEIKMGLMYRKKMAEDEGMLFLFPQEADRSFWMKNTYIELDIIFLDSQKLVVSISPKAVPLSETARPSEKPAKYVLEIRGGLAETWGIDVGSQMVIETGDVD